MGTPLGDAIAQNIDSKADEWDFTEGVGSVLRRTSPDVVLDIRDGTAKLLHPFYRNLNSADDLTNISEAAKKVDVPVDGEEEKTLIESLGGTPTA